MAPSRPEVGKAIQRLKGAMKMFTTKNSKPLVYGLILATSLGIGAARASADDQDVSTSTLTLEGYCHLRFPAIQGRTLSSDHPQLKSEDSGDIVDFYGPCDHDPLGKDEVDRQKEELEIRRQAGVVEG
jgi:hypothetical protein